MKIVLLTGCAGGIGEEISKKFKAEDWTVIGVDIKQSYKSKYVDLYIEKDLSKSNSIKEIITIIQNKYDKIDCLINNAAYQVCQPIWDTSEEDWDKVYSCNVKAIYLFVKYGLELLKKSKGCIINIASVHSIATSNKIAAYASSKSAIVGLTKNLAIELGQFDINVNSISPGAINTQMLKDGLKRGHVGLNLDENEMIKNLANKHVIKKIGEPSDIASFCLFLSSSTTNFFTGSNFVIDGGASIKLSTE